MIDDLDDPPKRLRLHAVGGLSNRLRAVMSYRAMGPIDVVWDADEYVSHARWQDIFEGVHGVRFVVGRWDVEAFAPAPGAPAGWERGYLDLRLIQSVARQVAGRMDGFGSYVAIHVRRTDMVPLAAQEGRDLETLESYVTWAEGWAPCPVYIATDNGVTQEALTALFGSRARLTARLIGVAVQGLIDHRRNGSLVDAVTDLSICCGARAFRGTSGSSFSDLVTTIRRLSADTHL